MSTVQTLIDENRRRAEKLESEIEDLQKQIKVEIIANELDLFAYKKSSPSTSEEPEIADEDIDF